MINPLRIMVAEDSEQAMEIIVKQINKFTDITFEITECDTHQKALSKLSESERNNKPFHFLFIDIDFTGDDHGGKPTSGFEIIKKAFEICPVSIIATYSAQYKTAELEPEHQELVRNGFIVYTFDKDHRGENPREWFSNGFKKLLNDFERNFYLWEIWQNHNEIAKSIKSSKLSSDFQQNLLKQDEIISNLETILKLLQKLSLIGADIIVFRLILQLYHRNLELFCAAEKSEKDIYEISEKNKIKLASQIDKKNDWELGKDISALRRILSFEIDEIAKFGWRLNDLRNKSVHPIQKRKDGAEYKFIPELSNIFFANLVLTLYAVGNKKKIAIDKYLELISEKEFEKNNRYGLSSLNELIEFIK